MNYLLFIILLLLPLPGWAGELIPGEDVIQDAHPSSEELKTAEVRYGVCGLVYSVDTMCTGSSRHKQVYAEWAALTAAALLANQREHSATCLATMQAAMQAMEFFSLLSFEGTYQMSFHYVQPDMDRLILPYENPIEYTPYGLTQTLNAKAGRAIVLWAEAQRCWVKP